LRERLGTRGSGSDFEKVGYCYVGGFNLKKLLLILAIALFGSSAFAQDMHFGAKLAFDTPQFVGLFLRSDFGDRSEPGFGLRVTAGGLVLLNVGVFNLELNGYYRFARQINGSGAYVGGGIGFFNAFGFTPDGTASTPIVWYINGLLGYEIQLGDGVQFYLEVRPTIPLNNSTNLFSIISIWPLFGLGFLFEF
jgi:hypothetical protein